MEVGDGKAGASSLGISDHTRQRDSSRVFCLGALLPGWTQHIKGASEPRTGLGGVTVVQAGSRSGDPGAQGARQLWPRHHVVTGFHSRSVPGSQVQGIPDQGPYLRKYKGAERPGGLQAE